MRKLVKVPSELLRQRSKEVKEIDSKVKALAKDLVEFIRLHQANQLSPIGLAAPQLGELLRVIAFSRNPASPEKNIQVLINPELVYQKGKHLVSESCLSIPGKEFRVKRAKIVKIRGLTLDNEVRSFRGRDLSAHVFQQELDHLDGILIDQIGVEK